MKLSQTYSRLLCSIAVGLMIAGFTGCASWRRPSFQAPSGFNKDPLAAQLLNPVTRAATWDTICPAPPKLQFGGQITASGRWSLGSDTFNTNYFSFRPGQGEPTVRFIGFNMAMQTTIFDMLVHKGRMRVMIMAPKKAAFEGPIPKEGSPLRELYGVEPWQIANVFLIGRELATNRFSQTNKSKRLIVVPVKAASENTPASIELDSVSGLPAKATWNANGQQYEVYYRAWDWFRNKHSEETGSSDEPQLMPKHLQIRREKPDIRLDFKVESYTFGMEAPPQLFTMYNTEQVKWRPLAELKDALK